MNEDEIKTYTDELDRRAREGPLITITGKNGVTANIPQGTLDVLKELHGIDGIAEIQKALDEQ